MAFISIFFTACEIISFEQLETSLSVTVPDGFYENEFIRIEFSLPMNRPETESIITLKQNDYTVETSIHWNGNTCLIKPVNDFLKGSRYSLSINGMAKTDDGRYYTVNIFRSFIFGSEENIFRIKSIEFPVKNSSLEITFNKAIDFSSFEKNFLISPYIQVKKEISLNDTKVSITPVQSWDVNQFYTWSIKDSLSSDGYVLDKEYNGSFRYAKDITPLTVNGIYPVSFYDQNKHFSNSMILYKSNLSQIPLNGGLAFCFNKSVTEASLMNAMSVSPAISGHLVCNEEKNIYIFVPYKNLENDRSYEVRISDSLKDQNGIGLVQDYRKTFTVSAPYIEVKSISVNDRKYDPRNILKSTVSEIPLPESDTIFIDISFSTNIVPEKRNQILSFISLNSYFPDWISSPRLISAGWNKTGDTLSLEFNGFSKTDSRSEVLYRLFIKGGKDSITNTRGEYLKEDSWLFLKLI